MLLSPIVNSMPQKLDGVPVRWPEAMMGNRRVRIVD